MYQLCRIIARQGINQSRLLALSASYSTTTSSNQSSQPVKTKKNKKAENMDEFSKINPFYSKYEAKLKAVYNENPEHFLNTVNAQKQERIAEAAQFETEIKKAQMAYALSKRKKLDSIMKTELLTNHKLEDIKTIWNTYMTERGRLADVLTPDEYERLKDRINKYSTFVYPLPREQGYEFIMAQWFHNECHFTPLINYQAHGENAPSVMTAVYFDDLATSNSVVLEMVEMDAKNLKPEEAKYLLHQMKSYYLHSSDTDDKQSLLATFTHAPREFKHNELIKQVDKDNLSLDQFKS